ncbi:MAG: NADPH-dependent F420 reductase [Chloroflexi bacterium]|nr:NADPH-dependent F420 reductase [Chloroflexota bacterium]MYC02383.1 NADPH-dependent F420 reductase [Chloroflexota bacterium]
MATIGFIGGTGPEGLGLAMRLAMAGERILIGSRRIERAEDAAQTVRDAVTEAGGSPDAGGGVNRDVVEQSDVVIIVVPFDGHEATLNDLRDSFGDKLVIDAAVPLTMENRVPGISEVPQGSATEQAQALLPDARVVGAFHNLSARKLQKLSDPMEGDVLITADDADAKQQVVDLVGKMPDLRPIDAGPLSMSKFVEDLTALIIGMNMRYKTQAAVRMVGIDD